MSCPVLSCPVLSYHFLPCPVLSSSILSYHVMSYPVLSSSILFYHVPSCPVLSSSILSYHVMSYPVLCSLQLIHFSILFFSILVYWTLLFSTYPPLTLFFSIFTSRLYLSLIFPFQFFYILLIYSHHFLPHTCYCIPQPTHQVDWEEYNPPLYRQQWGRVLRSPIKATGTLPVRWGKTRGKKRREKARKNDESRGVPSVASLASSLSSLRSYSPSFLPSSPSFLPSFLLLLPFFLPLLSSFFHSIYLFSLKSLSFLQLIFYLFRSRHYGYVFTEWWHRKERSIERQCGKCRKHSLSL